MKRIACLILALSLVTLASEASAAWRRERSRARSGVAEGRSVRSREAMSKPLYDRQAEVEATLKGSRAKREKTAALLPLVQFAEGTPPQALDKGLGAAPEAYGSEQREMVEDYLQGIAARLESAEWKDALSVLDAYFERDLPFDDTDLSELWLKWKTEGMSPGVKAAFCAERWFGVVPVKGVDEDVFADALGKIDSEDIGEPFERAFRACRFGLSGESDIGRASATAELMTRDQLLTPDKGALDKLARDKSEFKKLVCLLMMMRLGRSGKTVEDLFFHFWRAYPPGGGEGKAGPRVYRTILPKRSIPLMRRAEVVKKLLAETDKLALSEEREDARLRIFRMLQTGPAIEGVRPLVERYVRAHAKPLPADTPVNVAVNRAAAAARSLLRSWRER
jgi:hypothetical protein